MPTPTYYVSAEKPIGPVKFELFITKKLQAYLDKFPEQAVTDHDQPSK